MRLIYMVCSSSFFSTLRAYFDLAFVFLLFWFLFYGLGMGVLGVGDYEYVC